jgi:NADPH:quinone reductase-like Zn-dependent oxidoreductase
MKLTFLLPRCSASTRANLIASSERLLPGETVLVLGSGGVALFALQFAKLFAARVIATTSSDEKAKKLKAAGADEVINLITGSSRPRWTNQGKQHNQ